MVYIIRYVDFAVLVSFTRGTWRYVLLQQQLHNKHMTVFLNTLYQGVPFLWKVLLWMFNVSYSTVQHFVTCLFFLSWEVVSSVSCSWLLLTYLQMSSHLESPPSTNWGHTGLATTVYWSSYPQAVLPSI